MRGILLFLAASIIFMLAGCSENGTSVNQPTTNQKELIKLPAKASLSTELQTSVTQKIDGDEGGLMILSNSYLSQTGNIVSINAVLTIPEGAFEGNRNINITADNEYADIYFFPHMTFDQPLQLTLTFSGLDLSELGLSNGKVGFYYVDDQGNMTPVFNKGIIVNNITGTIMVLNAKLDHFSRYAFGK